MIRDLGLRRCGVGLLLFSIGVPRAGKAERSVGHVYLTTVWKKGERLD